MPSNMRPQESARDAGDLGYKSAAPQRRLPVGAEISPKGVHFRVWAPAARRVCVRIQHGGRWVEHGLTREHGGYFSLLAEARVGDLYGFRLDGRERLLPDPASRFQPDGPHGPSQIIDPARYRWRDDAWRGVRADGQIIYELHIGTFTKAGNWAAARAQLPRLADIGVTLLELMPVAEFPGSFGWGYDGVDLFAPTRLYGEPDEFRAFVDDAHGFGLGVILDVVYNHLGPDGNYLEQFSPAYFTDRYENEWGRAINFDGPNSDPVREFFIANAQYWSAEYHLDGLRLDATHQIFDESSRHILSAVRQAVREGAGGRSTFVVAENEPERARLARPVSRGGMGLDAIWNEDFHHSAHVALTGRREGYYENYGGSPQELISATKYGFLFQGQWYEWQKQPRGEPALDLPSTAFIHFIQNHDQVANSAAGQRLHELTSPGRLRAITALLLLGPATPMLFQGQEFAASSPFLYFADHRPELASAVSAGRSEFLAQFPSLTDPEIQSRLPDPSARDTFERSKLDEAQVSEHAPTWRLHRDLIRLRREDAVFRLQQRERIDGAVLGSESFLLRFSGKSGDARLLLVNLGPDVTLLPGAEPLLAPPAGGSWTIQWTSEHPDYGGEGVRPFAASGPWTLTAASALVLRPAEAESR
jgi:maltooligosyltrehalose trehalohydrolase